MTRRNMKGLLALLLVCVTVSCQDPIKCRRCIGAASLDECLYIVTCLPGEICYMDEVITDQLTIEYHGGCRPQDICSRGPGFGKRDGALVACRKCCDVKMVPECNTELCGIKNTNTTACNHCVTYGSGGSCTELVACPNDQMCGTESYTLSTERTNLFECLPKQRCVTETLAALHRKDACINNPTQCMATTPTSKTAAPEYTKCYACCGDDQCNWRTCEQTIDHLYLLWKAGVLDTTTLKQNGSLPSTTTASG